MHLIPEKPEFKLAYIRITAFTGMTDEEHMNSYKKYTLLSTSVPLIVAGMVRITGVPEGSNEEKGSGKDVLGF